MAAAARYFEKLFLREFLIPACACVDFSCKIAPLENYCGSRLCAANAFADQKDQAGRRNSARHTHANNAPAAHIAAALTEN